MTTQHMMDRVSQGAAANSAALRISAQRVMSPGQVALVAKELYTFYRMVQGLKVFADTYRSGQTQLIGTTPIASMFAFAASAGAVVNLAPGLTIEGGKLIGGHFSAVWNPAGVTTPAEFVLSLDGEELSTRSLQGLQVLPYIYALPDAMYRNLGGFLDELASSTLRSDLSSMVLSTAQRVTLNKIVSGDIKGMVSDLYKVPQGQGKTVLLSGAVIAARMAAESDALPILASSFPTLHSALARHEGVGTAVS